MKELYLLGRSCSLARSAARPPGWDYCKTLIVPCRAEETAVQTPRRNGRRRSDAAER
jgi:hypothetical protein